MSFSQETKNGSTAPLGSIKDRIKSFEFMKDERPDTPRARSPITAWNGENPRMIRRAINTERDPNTERRQIRRSERREAALKQKGNDDGETPLRENVTREETALRQTQNEMREPGLRQRISDSRNETGLRERENGVQETPFREDEVGETTFNQRENESREAVLRQRENENRIDKSADDSRLFNAPTPNERRVPKVPPRVKEKPTEIGLRKRIQDFKEAKVVTKAPEPPEESSSNVGSQRTTESSSNETIDFSTSDDIDTPAQGTVEKKSGEKGKKKLVEKRRQENKRNEIENRNNDERRETDRKEKIQKKVEERVKERQEDVSEEISEEGSDEENEEGEVKEDGESLDDDLEEDEEELEDEDDVDEEDEITEEDEEEKEDKVEIEDEGMNRENVQASESEEEDSEDSETEEEEFEEEEEEEEEGDDDEEQEEEQEDEEEEEMEVVRKQQTQGKRSKQEVNSRFEKEMKEKKELAKMERQTKERKKAEQTKEKAKLEQQKLKSEQQKAKAEQQKAKVEQEGKEREVRKEVKKETHVDNREEGSRKLSASEKRRSAKISRDQIINSNLKDTRKHAKSSKQQHNQTKPNETECPTEKDDKLVSLPVESSQDKTKKCKKEDEQTKNISTRKAKRTLSKNSLRLSSKEVLAECGKQQNETSNERRQSLKSEISDNENTTSNEIEEDVFQCQGMNECVSSPNFYPSTVFDKLPISRQHSQKGEETLPQPGDINHDNGETTGKKGFVCAIHEEQCRYYCQDCERLICSECAMRWGDCHEHYYMRVKDAWKKYREEMQKVLQEARLNVSRIQDDILENSKSRDSFKLKVDSTIKKINSFFDDHVQAVEKRRTIFLRIIEDIMKFREIGINQEIDSLQNNLVETSSTINIAGRVYGTSTMMEFLQVCKQFTNHLLELGQKKIKAHLTENVDIDFISEPNLFEEIEGLGQLRKHRLSLANVWEESEDIIGDQRSHIKQADSKDNLDENSLSEINDEPNTKENSKKAELVAQDSIDTSIGTSTENLSETTSTKDTNDQPTKPQVLPNSIHHTVSGNQELRNSQIKPKTEVMLNSQVLLDVNGSELERNDSIDNEVKYEEGKREENVKKENNDAVENEENKSTVEDQFAVTEIEPCFCNNECPEQDVVRYRDGFSDDNFPGIKNFLASDTFVSKLPNVAPEREYKNESDFKLNEREKKHEDAVKQESHHHHHMRRHSMDDTLARRSKKEEIQRRLGNMTRLKTYKADDGERYFSSGEAEQRRRKQEYYKVRFNDRAYYSNPSDSSELEEMKRYDFEETNRTVKQRIRRHRTMPLIRPISERQREKYAWTLDAIRYHGKIHFSRNSLKATGKAFGWNAVVGSMGFATGKHSWKVRVTKWTAVGVCYKDDHMDNPSWGAGNKWTWDSADMCYSPRLGVCESPVGEWIDGDVIALELDCDNSVLIVHNLRTLESDKLFGFKEPVYPYFYLSVFRSISLIEIDGVQVG